MPLLNREPDRFPQDLFDLFRSKDTPHGPIRGYEGIVIRSKRQIRIVDSISLLRASSPLKSTARPWHLSPPGSGDSDAPRAGPLGRPAPAREETRRTLFRSVYRRGRSLLNVRRQGGAGGG